MPAEDKTDKIDKLSPTNFDDVVPKPRQGFGDVGHRVEDESQDLAFNFDDELAGVVYEVSASEGYQSG